MVALVWGAADDPPVAAVMSWLERLGAPHLRVADDVSGLALHGDCDEPTAGTLIHGAGSLPLDRVTGLYVRPPDDGAAPFGALDRGLVALAEGASARVFNRPSAMASNHSKPYQLRRLAVLGFAVPETLITTTPETARAFCASHGAVIYKSVSGIRSRVTRVGPAQFERLEEVRWCPTQFQRHVAGVDVRVHVVEDAVFACEVRSQADDYRYPGEGDAPAYLAPLALPEDVRARCLATSAAFALPLTGIDLRRSNDGRWYAFEVNPSPAFTCFDAAQADAIAETIARALLAPR